MPYTLSAARAFPVHDPTADALTDWRIPVTDPGKLLLLELNGHGPGYARSLSQALGCRHNSRESSRTSSLPLLEPVVSYEQAAAQTVFLCLASHYGPTPQRAVPVERQAHSFSDDLLRLGGSNLDPCAGLNQGTDLRIKEFRLQPGRPWAKLPN
jgi:hypothetical protein